MFYLYAVTSHDRHKLLATFDTQPQLLGYVGWAKVGRNPDGTSQFRPESVLAGYDRWEQSVKPLTDDVPAKVTHNPPVRSR
ncbi:MAG: hypothetical protein ACT4QC_12530 [Planctomycetaceae bacterium]